MQDCIVLMSILGGMALFGMQGLVSGLVVAATVIAVWATFPALPEA